MLPMLHVEDSSPSDHSRTHLRAQQYTNRVPTPPRIVIPPPAYGGGFNPQSIGNDGNGLSDTMNMSFLKDLDYQDFQNRSQLIEWKYEKRRQAQSILPFLYLGPSAAARDEDFLQQHGITMTLAILPRSNIVWQAPITTAQNLGIEFASVDIGSPIRAVPAFDEAAHLINKHLHGVHAASGGKTLGRVLVFCESGNDRSAHVTASYIINMFTDIDFVKSMQLVQQSRFCVNFDDPSKQVLRTYWDILCARRIVRQSSQLQFQNKPEQTRANQSKATNPTLQLNGFEMSTANGQDTLNIVAPVPSRNTGKNWKLKRTIEDAYEEDIDMEIDRDRTFDDVRFQREGHAPFADPT
jgi:serine/threonine/tyrosine-interacting protein